MTTIPFNTKININGLRKCQKEAYKAILNHFSKEDAEKHILVQLPTGAGKSALIVTIPFNESKLLFALKDFSLICHLTQMD